MIGVLVKMVICGIPVHVILSVKRHVSTCKYLVIKNYWCEKHLSVKLLLARKDIEYNWNHDERL